MSDLVNLHELKARLSHYTRLVKSGETVIVCERNVPIAELRPLQGQDLEPVQRPEPGLFNDVVNSEPARGAKSLSDRNLTTNTPASDGFA